MRRHLLLLGAVLALIAVPAATASAFRLPANPKPISGNPAHRLMAMPIDDIRYDPARRCAPKSRPGVVRMVAWLQRNARGVNWGTYRCEKWGKDSASLHAENRAIDWALDVRDRADRRAGQALIRLLLAPDAQGNPFALARRMGVEELIWDCSYWGAGMPQFKQYAPCYGRSGKRRKRVNPTVGHLDHIHIGMSRRGAAARTTFWTATA
jgi:hypothetical protein